MADLREGKFPRGFVSTIPCGIGLRKAERPEADGLDFQTIVLYACSRQSFHAFVWESGNVRVGRPRRRLLEAAGEIFAEKGFEGGQVRKIKDRADVNIAAVNYYFRSKEHLYIEAVKGASCGSLDHSPC